MSYNDDSQRREDERRAQQQRDEQQRRDQQRAEQQREDQRRAEQQRADDQRRADDRRREEHAQEQRRQSEAARAAADRLAADNARRDADNKRHFDQKDLDRKTFFDRKDENTKKFYDKKDADQKQRDIDQRGRDIYVAKHAREAETEEQRRSNQLEDADRRWRAGLADDEARRRNQSSSTGTSEFNSPPSNVSGNSMMQVLSPDVPEPKPTSGFPPRPPAQVARTAPIEKSFKGNAAPAPAPAPVPVPVRVRVWRSLLIISIAAFVAVGAWRYPPSKLQAMFSSVNGAEVAPRWTVPEVRALLLGQIHVPATQFQMATAFATGSRGIAPNKCLAAFFYKKVLDNPASKNTLHDGEIAVSRQAYEMAVRGKTNCRVVIHSDRPAVSIVDLIELKGQPANAVSETFAGLNAS